MGGWIRERPEDFLVEEMPAYMPCGEGEHIYLFVEKRMMSTLGAARVLAAHFGVPMDAVGYAGLKDRVAVTRQVFSVHVPGRGVGDFPALEHDRLRVLWVDRHTNKLRRGHLAGNRFSIRIRGVDVRAVLHARRAVEMLTRVGVPNRFGEQRFGYLWRNHLVGRALILDDAPAALEALLSPAPGRDDAQAPARALYAAGEYRQALRRFARASVTERRVLRGLAQGRSPREALAALEPIEQEFFITAFQSAVFNAVLDARLREGTLGTLRVGDLAQRHDNGAVFAVDAASLGPELSARVQALEVSPSGPLWGVSMARAAGRTDEEEQQALQATGVTVEALASASARGLPVKGARRPLRVPLRDPDVEAGADEHGPYIRVTFDLPPGAFATAVLQEIIKPQRTGIPWIRYNAGQFEPRPDET